MPLASRDQVPLRRSRDLVIVAAGQAISALGNTVAATTLLLYMQAHGRTSWAVAGVLAAEMVPLVLFAPLAGMIVDRLDSRLLIVVASGWQAAACVGLALCTSLPLVFPLVFAVGCGSALAGPTFSALLPRIAGEERIAAAASLLATSTGIAAMAGPGLAGLLYGASGLRLPFFVDAASFLAVTAAAFLVRTRRKVVLDSAKSAPRMRDGLTSVLANRVVRSMVLMLAAFVVVGEATNVVEVYFVRKTLGQSATTYGLLGTVFTFSLLAGSALAGRWNGDRQLVRAVSGSGFVLAAALALLAIVPTIGWVFAVFVVFGAANGVINVSSSALLIRATPEPERGRVLAAFSGIARAAGLGALVLGGALASAFSPRHVVGMCGLAALATLAVTLPPLLRTVPTIDRAELSVAP